MKRRDLLLVGSGMITTSVLGGINLAVAKSTTPAPGRMVKLDADLSGYYVAPKTKRSW